MDNDNDHPQLSPPLHNSSSPRDKEPKEFNDFKKWREERIQRRLKGEYESYIMHLSELINDNLDSRVNVSAVRVEGATNTRQSFLASIITPAIPPPSDPSSDKHSTLGDALHAARSISAALNKTDIFSKVEAYIDKPRSALASPTDVDLVFKTKEKGRWYVSSSTELGNNEGSASASARIRNVFGGAEVFEANVSTGTKTRRAFRGALTAPLTSDLKTYGELSAYGSERDLTAYASCHEAIKGVRAVIRNATPGGVSHELAYDAVLRHIHRLTSGASIGIRTQAGPSLKSSLSHTLLYDTRDDKITGTRGVYFKLFNELAGLGPLGGDERARFWKSEVEGAVSRSIGRGVALGVTAKAGYLHSFANEGTTLFSDRFQLGGPTSVRGFKMNGMGPRSGEDSLGGEVYYSAGLSVVGDIPTKEHWPVKLHGWMNAGRLDTIGPGAPKPTPKSLLTQPSISAGLGLIYRFDPIRVEVNFGVPLAMSRGEAGRRGVQVGMGLEFV
ncbi:surface antigen-domain-containing protein [Panaeolus papilionaceus]|nr:surface antigen-domain-containing protein [Panaeolus papilionaceus]